MAQIISVSLTKQNLEDMNYLQKKLGFSGKSEIVRVGIKNLLEEHKKINEIVGEIEGTIIVTHKEENIEEFSKIKHSFHDFVKTHIHQELKNHNCMEILLFKGDSKQIKEIYSKLLSSKKIDLLKIIIP